MFQRWIRGPYSHSGYRRSYHRLLTCIIVGCAFFLCSLSSFAYIFSKSSSTGNEVHWIRGAHLTFRTNETNSSGLSSDQIFSIFTTSLQRWKQLSFGGFDFTYYQGTDANNYPKTVGSSTDNQIFFTSQATSQSDQLSAGVIALTVVYFDANSGVASKADLRFNDTYFRFTTNPADTVSQSYIYLADVATHELGHALGLDHSENLQSTMIYTASIEMSKPSCDDQAAFVHLYAPGNVQANYGSIAGKIDGPSGAVFGAHVDAISLERGTVLASGLSDKDGSFQINGLEPGHYSILVEPYYPGPSTLNRYYSQINSNLCGSNPFERTFEQDRNELKSFTVLSGGKADAGTITISCSAPASLNHDSEESLNSAPILASSSLGDPIATQSVFGNNKDHYYMLKNQTGHLVANVLAYSLFSPANTQVEFLDKNGRSLPQNIQSPKFNASDSGYTNYDSETSMDLSSAQDVIVHVSSTGTINNTSFPSSGMGLSSTPYYVVAVSRGIASNPLYTTNARCEQEDRFGAYSRQGDAPPNDNGSSGGGGCGTIYNDNDPSSNNPFGPQASARMMNFGLIMMMLIMAHRQLRRHYGKNVQYTMIHSHNA